MVNSTLSDRKPLKNLVEHRRNRMVAKLAKAEGAIVVASDDVAEDAGRCIVAPDDKVDACAALQIISVQSLAQAETRAEVLELGLSALDVTPEAADVAWARENVSKVARIIRSVPRGAGRAQGIVKAIRAARKVADVVTNAANEKNKS